MTSRLFVGGLIISIVLFPPALVWSAPAENVILVTFDGLRWQEMFSGLDMRLVNDEEGGMESATDYRKSYNADTPEERREILLPFMWTEIAKKGVILGAPEANS